MAGPFDIQISYSGNPLYQSAFDAAAAHWEQIITADIPDVFSASYGFIDDLLIDASVVAIDGVGGILGQAGPDELRNGSHLPDHGVMEFDSADVAQMYSAGTLTNVILHEIGHILGVGSLWATLGLKSGSSYIGAHAVAQYKLLTGNASLSSVPIETGGGPGTAGVHWSEAVFDNELMTGYAEPGAMPLSALTIGSLQDIGYSVNYAAADLYVVPGTSGGVVPGGIAWDFNWKLSAVGDYNSDGTSDAIWLAANGVMGGWLMQDAAIGGTLQLPFFPGFTAIASGDFNGDGIDDVMWQAENGLVAEWFMGQGTRQATASIKNMAGWKVIATGDFNGDGTDDVVWNSNGVLGSWLMHDGQIAGTLQLPFFPGWSVVAAGDFNNDGIDDLLWQSASGVVGEWLMGGGTRAATVGLGSMAGWTALGGGDFNNDGVDDVLWRDAGGVTKVWLMNNGSVQQQIFEGVSSAFEFKAIGDFNGDGFDDIMWQNKTTGSISFWKMGPGGTVASVETSPAEQSEVPTTVAAVEALFDLDTFNFVPVETMPQAAGQGLDFLEAHLGETPLLGLHPAEFDFV